MDAELITPIISIGQHLKSLILLNEIVKFLGYGTIAKSKGQVKEIRIARLSSMLRTHLIEKLNEHQLYGAKYLDYLDFCKGCVALHTARNRDHKKKEHLCSKGKNQIKLIYSSAEQNQRRKDF